MPESSNMYASFAWMQARLVELLLRHDAPAFTESFGERVSGPLADPRLSCHRELAALWHLRGELFEEILPRVKRRLSFAAPHEMGVEPLPPRGRVDWAQTAAAGLHDRPGQPPLEARTRQRRRHFGTPENLLVVVTLLEYRGAADRHLAGELASVGAALRHPLQDIVASCDRELAFPPLAGLRGEAEGLIRVGDLAASNLATQVAEQLPPGRTSAYDDLIAWRERLGALQLAAPEVEDVTTLALGADPERDDALYEAWLFYELADLLRERDSLARLDSTTLTFAWGDGASRRDYQLRLRPELAEHWENAPAISSGLLIEREQPQEVHSPQGLIWREPGFLVGAAFAPGAGGGAHARRLLGDLQLAGGRRGALSYAHGEDNGADNKSAPLAVRPGAALDAPAPDTRIELHLITPRSGDERGPWGALEQLLQEAHEAIGEVAPVACHGVFLDAFSVAERRSLVGRDGLVLTDEAHELLICPKPHVGPWRVDLVSRAQHCCRDVRLCHIIGQAGARPPVRPPRTTDELLRELDHLFETRSPEELDEEAISAVTRRIEAITQRFAEVAGDFGDVTVYEGRLRDSGMDRTLDLLGAGERQSLALAVYLVDKLDRIHAGDFSAPTIHLARVLEREIQRRVMSIPGVTEADFPHRRPTLGSLHGTRRKKPELWALITSHVAGIWDGRVDPGDLTFTVTFEQFLAQLTPIVGARNQAAHTTPISRQRYGDLFRDVCRGGALRVGALNALLLAWRADR